MKPVPRAVHLVLYDDHCSLCTFQMRLLTWLDWFNVVGLVPISNEGARRAAGDLPLGELKEAIHCVSQAGRIYRGARCLRFVGMRMPLLMPLALFLWIPGVIFVAEWVYQRVSQNRYVLSRIFGCKDACAVFPARQRDNEAVFPAPEPVDRNG